MDPILFGHNPEERVVAVHLLNDQAVRLYRRDNGKTLHTDAEFFPFFFLTDPELLRDFSGRHWIKDLAGTNPFRTIAAFSRWSDMWEGVQVVLRNYNRTRSPKAGAFYDVASLFFRPDPVRQYLTQSGITLFKGMEFRDLRRVQIDLQVRSSSSGKRGVRKAGPEWLIALTSTDGSETTLDARSGDESSLLRSFVSWLQQHDPDIIEGFRLGDRIIPFLLDRADACGVDLTIGRDGEPLRQGTIRGWFATGEVERTQFEAAGRHLIDLLHLLQGHDTALHAVESSTLKPLAVDLGIAEEYPAPLTADQLNDLWAKKKGNGIAAHALRRARFARSVAERLLAVPFQHSRLCPFNLTMVAQLGLPAKIESILVREYVREKHSLPYPGMAAAGSSPVSVSFRFGLYRNVLRTEYDSLGAAIIRQHHLVPRSDPLEAFPRLASALLAIHAETPVPERTPFSALLRAMPAYLANPRALFTDRQQSETLSNTFVSLLADLGKTVELFNGVPVHASLDGFYCALPDNIVGRANEEQFLERVKEHCPSLIDLAHGPHFRAMLAYNQKSFALLDDRDRLLVYGTSLIPRSSERFIRQYVQRCIECLLTEDLHRLHHTYASFNTMITRHRWKVTDFCRSEIAHETLEEYQQAVSTGSRNLSPAYEAARRAGIYVTPGSRISYYVTGTQEDVRIVDSCRVAEEWDANLPDENSAYYLHRLREAAARFRDFFREGDFERIFSMDDLFGFTAKGIEVSERPAEPILPESPSAERESADEFGIWLAEGDEPT